MIDATDAQALPLARRAGPLRAPPARLSRHGGLTAVAIWSELGDCRRFSRSMQVVRHAGIDVTVDASDRHRAKGHLSHQGPEILRWALDEAAKSSSRHGSPHQLINGSRTTPSF